MMREALDLWRGAPLADFEFEPFAQSEIARLKEERLAVVEERIDADLEAGRHAEIVGEVESLVDRHPTRERLRAHLMLALYRSGRQTEALEVYQDARRTLVNELGIEPGRDLQQLHGEILRQDAGLRAPDSAPPAEDHFDEVLPDLARGSTGCRSGSRGRRAGRQACGTLRLCGNGAGLPRVAQYVSVMKGSGPLYDELHALLDADVPPTAVHRFFASIPPVLRERGVPHQLIVTTSYDLALEAAFLEAGEEFDVVSYIATGPRSRQVLPHHARRRRPAHRSAEHVRHRAFAGAAHGHPQTPWTGRSRSRA